MQTSPMLIESYFDGELRSEELEAVSREEIVETETWKALEELREVVRTESELELDDIDGFDLLESIHSKMDSVDAEEPHPVTKPSRTVRNHGIRRWIPAAVGAALLLLSIPGWIGLFSSSDQAQDVPSMIYVDNSRQQPSRDVVCPTQQYWQENAGNDAVAAPLDNPITKGDQLTVEEMDFAIRHLIRRIKDLEDANRQGVENGDISLKHGSLDAPVHQM